jgi:putative membrane protein
MRYVSMRAAICCGVMVMGLGSAFAGAQTGSDTAAQDKEFVAKSAEGSMAEIAMSKLALKKSKNDEVKTFAQKMIDDHTTLISNMKPFADQMGVKPPSKLKKEHQDEMTRLQSMSGDKFDKEYVTAMVGDHHKDLGEFTSEASTTSNAELKTTVEAGTQVIKMHTEMIDQIAQKDGIQTPPMPSM